MKKYAILFFSTFLILSCSSSKKIVTIPIPSIFDFRETINQEGLRADLSVLAHDSLEGRNTGSKGLATAADYLADRYKMLGLEPVGDNGSFFQTVELFQSIKESISYVLSSGDGNLISNTTHNKDETAQFYTLIGGERKLEGKIVFAGFGIKNEQEEINQYPEDINGKWLLLFYDREITNFSVLQSHIGEKKAIGALLIMGTGIDSFTAQAERLQGSFGGLGNFSLAYLEEEDSFKSAISRIHPKTASILLGAESVEALANLEQKIKDSPAEFTSHEIDYILSHDPVIIPNTIESNNIVAFIEGTDSLLKEEIVVLSSHYDHVGIGVPDSTGDAIYNGADDDGSGTVGVLHTAQALMAAKKAGTGTKRSILFLTVTGEEKGLLGSRYYSDHPIFPIENTVANINVDMIGRRDYEHPDDGDYIYVIGGKIISSGLQTMLEEANTESVNIVLSDRYNDLEDTNQFYRRSDHWNFGRLGVPFVFFFNGVHDDYHQPSDEIEKIDFEALQKRSQLLFMITAKIANAELRPEVDNQEFINKTKQQPR